MIVGLVIVAPFWIGVYLVGGWPGVAVVVLVALLGEVLLAGADEIVARRDRREALRRLEAMR